MIIKTLHPPQFDLSIIIPAYNEAQRIGQTLDELALFLKSDNYFKARSVEVIVVSADSTDKTWVIILKKQKLFKHFKLITPGPKVGKGRDVQQGMLGSSGKIAVYMDADLATPLYHLEEFYKLCTSAADIVIGTRNLLTYRPNLFKRLFAYCGNILYRIFGGLWIEDSQCGFKMFNRRAADLCFSSLTILGWRFDMEILTIAKANSLKIAKIRINDWIDAPGSTFSESLTETVVFSLRDLVKIAFKRLAGSYKA